MRPTLFLLLIWQATASAQRDGLPSFTLKANAGTLISPGKQAIALTTDVRLAPNVSLDLGTGYFFHSASFTQYKGESYQGLRLRSGIKFFPDAAENAPIHLGIEAKHNNIRHLKYREVLRQGGQYQETLLTERTVRSWGVAGRFGGYFYEGARRRLLFEPYVGLGVVFHRVSIDLPPDAELLERGGLLSFEYPVGRRRLLDLLLGLHIGYAFW
ncbi:MAG: hypothetical protein KIS77_14755 [Saprospiraceae bacterium]|nr:hypothetical protein [Saprospiraceae bacterium]